MIDIIHIIKTCWLFAIFLAIGIGLVIADYFFWLGSGVLGGGAR